jgi:hypothetical protein
LANTVEGEQKRVYNKITHYCHDKMFYINRVEKAAAFHVGGTTAEFPGPR